MMIRLGLLLVLSALTACGMDNSNAASASARVVPATQQPADAERVEGEYILTFNPELRERAEALTKELFQAYGVEELRTLGRRNHLLRLRRDPGPTELQQIIRQRGLDIRLEPNFIYHTSPDRPTPPPHGLDNE